MYRLTKGPITIEVWKRHNRHAPHFGYWDWKREDDKAKAKVEAREAREMMGWLRHRRVRDDE